MLERLTARQAQTAKATTRPTMLSDGGGLYLRVQPTGGKSWVFRYRAGDAQHDLGLGSYPDVSLAKARELARAQRDLRRDGKDPAAERRARRDAAALEHAKTISFAECVDMHLRAHGAAWKGDKHEKQWRASLARYVLPVIGALPVATVDTGLVLKVVEPLWTEKQVTADRVRRRIESVLDYANARGWRAGDNPARWRGHLEHLLADKASKPVEHYAALAHAELPAFMRELRDSVDIRSASDPRKPEDARNAIRALEFLILTCARTDEVLGATWSEIDLKQRVWTIPPERTKAKREHRVPLSAAAVKLLGEPRERGAFVFATSSGGKPYRHLFQSQLKRMDRDVTAHGFRSSFRDWCADRGTDNDLAEMALGHTVGTRTDRAYRRGSMFERRRQLADQWARYCASDVTAAGAVVPLRSTTL